MYSKYPRQIRPLCSAFLPIYPRLQRWCFFACQSAQILGFSDINKKERIIFFLSRVVRKRKGLVLLSMLTPSSVWTLKEKKKKTVAASWSENTF